MSMDVIRQCLYLGGKVDFIIFMAAVSMSTIGGLMYADFSGKSGGIWALIGMVILSISAFLFASLLIKAYFLWLFS